VLRRSPPFRTLGPKLKMRERQAWFPQSRHPCRGGGTRSRGSPPNGGAVPYCSRGARATNTQVWAKLRWIRRDPIW